MFIEVSAQDEYELHLVSPSEKDDEGRLEIFYNSEWIPFSVDHFSMQVAELACQELGFSYASKYATVGALG